MDKRLPIAYFYYMFEGIHLEKKRQSMNSKVKAEEHIYEHGKQENIKGKDGKSKRG